MPIHQIAPPRLARISRHKRPYRESGFVLVPRCVNWASDLCCMFHKWLHRPLQGGIEFFAPGRAIPPEGGFGVCSGFSPIYAAAFRTSESCPSDQRKSVPSHHIRCITTASLRASATFANFTLRRFAIRIAQDRKEDQRP